LIQPGLTGAGPPDPGRIGEPKLAPDDVARPVMFALEQPASVDLSEIVIRPTGSNPTADPPSRRHQVAQTIRKRSAQTLRANAPRKRSAQILRAGRV
jgi:hypothetical protein